MEDYGLGTPMVALDGKESDKQMQWSRQKLKTG